MALTLSSEDRSRLASLQEALLSPLEHRSVEGWSLAVLRKAEELFQADRTGIWLPQDGGLFRLSENVEERYLDAFGSQIRRVEPGALRFDEPLVDSAHRRRRSRRLSVWNIPILAKMMDIRPEESELYHEAVEPAGIAHSVVINPSLASGEALLGIGHSNPDDDPFGQEAGLELGGLILPAFEAGLEALARLENRRKELARAVDELGEALAIFGAHRKEVHRSARLREILAADPDGETLVPRMQRLARDVLRFRDARRAEPSGAPGAEEVETDSARYTLRASLVGQGMLGLECAALVAVERLTPRLPSKRSLVERYELTPRQAEVALLLARGLSNREIGEQLGISHHTVRHHAEWVFTKLHIHTRKALALKLLSERG